MCTSMNNPTHCNYTTPPIEAKKQLSLASSSPSLDRGDLSGAPAQVQLTKFMCGRRAGA